MLFPNVPSILTSHSIQERLQRRTRLGSGPALEGSISSMEVTQEGSIWAKSLVFQGFGPNLEGFRKKVLAVQLHRSNLV
ncbi:MAG TPA: hypothetical protein VN436_01825, partial [Holophaga sp.]|nr:hypothetical protein [Holophaga sp.]